MAASFGFGGYRVGQQDPVHAESLKQAIDLGVRLIDTSTNYTDGESEQRPKFGVIIAAALDQSAQKVRDFRAECRRLHRAEAYLYGYKRNAPDAASPSGGSLTFKP